MSSAIIGKNRVTEAEVIQVEDVAFTRTFKPFPHRSVIDAIKTGIKAVGLDVVKSEYVLASNGLKMFGVWDLSVNNNDLCWSIGIRNSMDKSMALGITAGTKVFVCENLAFDGEFVELRRHTKGLSIEELEFMAYRAIRCLVGRLTAFQAWHENLRSYELEDHAAKILLVEILTQEVIPITKFSNFCDLYFNHIYEPTLWGFHGAVTQLMKDGSLLSMPKKNRLLNAILNHHVEGLTAELPSSLGSFYQQRAITHK